MGKVVNIQINEGSIKPRPMDVSYGKREQSTITTVADSTGSLNSTYWEFSAPNSDGTVVDYYVWYDVSSGGTDPAVSGKTGVEVDIATDDTAPTVATATQAALDALSDVQASVSSDVVTMLNEYFGNVDAVADSSGAATGFTFATSVAGFGGTLGATTGGIELGLEVEVVDALADQFGTTLLDQIPTGANITLGMSILELDAEKIKFIIGDGVGDSFTTGGSKELVGMGESKRFSNMTQYSGELILKPSGAANNDENYHFWKCYPLPESFSFSGTELNTMALSFQVFRDSTKNSAINIFAYGDGSELTDLA